MHPCSHSFKKLMPERYCVWGKTELELSPFYLFSYTIKNKLYYLFINIFGLLERETSKQT